MLFRSGAGDGVGFYANTYFGAGAGTAVPLMNISSTGVITTATWNGVTVGTGYGGTGLTSFTSGGALYATSTSALTTGTLPIASGGTNGTSFTNGQRVYFDGTKLASLSNTTTTVTGTLSANSTITSLSYNSYGDITAYTASAIAGLTVGQGGTGSSSFTVKGVIVSDSSSGTAALTALTSSTEGHVLQINSSGVPTFAHLNGEIGRAHV